MNPDDRRKQSNDANHLHITPEYGEQGEGPGEQPVRRVAPVSARMSTSTHAPTPVSAPGRSAARPMSIEITEISEMRTRPAPRPVADPRFNHGEEDVMQYFNTEPVTPRRVAPPTPTARRSTAIPIEQYPPAAPSSAGYANANHTNYDGHTGYAGPGRPVPPSGAYHNSNPNIGHNNIPNNPNDPNFTPGHAATPPVSHNHHGNNGQPATPSHHSNKKFSLAATITIVFITVLVTAIAVFVALLVTQDNKENITTTNNNAASADSVSFIVCDKASGSEAELKDAGDATKLSSTVIANYLNKKLEDYSVQTIYTYANAEAATAGLATIRNAYTKRYTDLGLGQDPFSSSYTPSDTKVTVSHFAERKNFTFDNIVLLDLPQTNGTNPDITAINKALTEKGYTCKQQSAN